MSERDTPLHELIFDEFYPGWRERMKETDNAERALSRPLSQLELDGLESLIEQDDVDHDTFCDMTNAVARLIREVRGHRARLKAEKTPT